MPTPRIETPRCRKRPPPIPSPALSYLELPAARRIFPREIFETVAMIARTRLNVRWSIWKLNRDFASSRFSNVQFAVRSLQRQHPLTQESRVTTPRHSLLDSLFRRKGLPSSRRERRKQRRRRLAIPNATGIIWGNVIARNYYTKSFS